VQGAKACFANYCSDNASALCTLSAQIELSGPGGDRRITLDELYSNKAQKPFDLQQGEILTAILIPKKKTFGDYEKIRIRGAIDYPLLGVAFSFSKGTGKLAVGAIGPKPYVVEMKQPSKDTIGESAETILRQVKLVNNTVLDADYRKRMIPVLAGRLVKKVMEGAE
jgi:4-hydroxybenzoyl-CoA reductase subunit beta